jgi:hypothetical protein
LSGRTVILLHPVLWGVSRDEVDDALPPERRNISHVVSIDIPWSSDTPHADWTKLKRMQEEQLRERLLPHLRQYPEDTVAYFGAAPIPLAMHLGFLIPTWARVEVYQQHHDEKHWRYAELARSSVQLSRSNVPSDRNELNGDVVLRVSASYEIDPTELTPLVESSIAHVGVSVDPLERDNLRSAADLDDAARTVIDSLEEALRHRPGADRVHLFLAGPVGLAFRIGSLINPTVVPPVSVYQYDRSSTPRYNYAFDLQDGAAPVSLDDNARTFAATVREAWTTEFDHIIEWARRFPTERTGPWLNRLALPAVDASALPPAMVDLPTIAAGRFKDTQLSAVRDVRDGFRFDQETRRWEMDDGLLHAIGQRLAPEDWARAARLFTLHEAVHLDAQQVTSELAFRIGVRHPLIAEEFDFRADAWAMLHELAYAWSSAEADPVGWLRRSVHVNTEIIWAFTEPAEATRRFELRRLRRLTVWYWQLLRLRDVGDLSEAVRRLLDKPVISLSGPPIHSVGGRTYLQLDRAVEFDPEAALLRGNRLIREGTSDAMDLRAAFDGLRHVDPRSLRRALAGLFANVGGGD